MLADLEITHQGGVVLVRLTGEIDMSNAGEVSGAIAQGTPNDALGVVLDLSAVEYLDSAGIHLLYRLRESLRARGQALKLVIPADSPVNSALRLAGVEGQIEISHTVDEATKQLWPAEAAESPDPAG
jgi:anti-anti-sigma factor